MNNCVHRHLLSASCMLVMVMILSGCDFLRRLAGRPTSDQIAIASEFIEAREQAVRDSLEQAQAEPVVSVTQSCPEDVVDSLRRYPRTYLRSEIGSRIQSKLDHLCYVVIGSFSVVDNAAALASKAEGSGYQTEILDMNGNLHAVAVIADGSATEIMSRYEEICSRSFVPKDAWMLIND